MLGCLSLETIRVTSIDSSVGSVVVLNDPFGWLGCFKSEDWFNPEMAALMMLKVEVWL